MDSMNSTQEAKMEVVNSVISNAVNNCSNVDEAFSAFETFVKSLGANFDDSEYTKLFQKMLEYINWYNEE